MQKNLSLHHIITKMDRSKFFSKSCKHFITITYIIIRTTGKRSKIYFLKILKKCNIIKKVAYIIIKNGKERSQIYPSKKFFKVVTFLKLQHILLLRTVRNVLKYILKKKFF